jgi:hypothetical protein
MSSNENLNTGIAALGQAINDILSDALTVEDVIAKRTTNIEFHANEEGNVYGKGLVWKYETGGEKLSIHPNPNRLHSTMPIDLHQEAWYGIGRIPVLRANELGPSVTKSHITETGTLKNLRTQGGFSLDDFLHYASGSDRLGINTDEPNGTLSVAGLASEFIVDIEGTGTRLGNYTNDSLEIITDNTARISVTGTGQITIGSTETTTNLLGSVGIGVANPGNDAKLSVAGPVKIHSNKITYADERPTGGSYKKGDIIFTTNPKPTGYVGWVCTRDGTPGVWKAFGQIAP